MKNVIKLQPIVDIQWFIDFYSSLIETFLTVSIQESLIMNQASGHAKQATNQPVCQLAIMSIVFNFTMDHVENVKTRHKNE